MSFLDPRTLFRFASLLTSNLTNVNLTNAGRAKEEDCDNVLREYSKFVIDFSSMDIKSKLRHCTNDNFDPCVDRVDIDDLKRY